MPLFYPGPKNFNYDPDKDPLIRPIWIAVLGLLPLSAGTFFFWLTGPHMAQMTSQEKFWSLAIGPGFIVGGAILIGIGVWRAVSKKNETVEADRFRPTRAFRIYFIIVMFALAILYADVRQANRRPSNKPLNEQELAVDLLLLVGLVVWRYASSRKRPGQ